MAKFEKNLSQGSVVKQLVLFSLPFLISNIIQSLYSVADMIIVGQFSGTISMSGVNIGGQASFLITNMVFGLSVGATVLIGQYLGAGNRQAMTDIIGTLFSMLGILAVVLTTLMIAVQTPFLKLIQTPVESFLETKTYFTITMLGTIFIFAYNALSAVMRGMGDSKNPLIFVAIACVCNIVLDIILVAKFNMGAAGAAIATVASQALSVILCIIYLAKNNFVFDFKPSSFKIKKDSLKMILKIGVPTSVQNVATSVSFLFLTALVNIIGVTASAAVGAVGKINSFAILPALAMSASVSAMGAQNIGAGENKRAVKTMLTGMTISFAIGAVIYILTNMFPEMFLRAFGNDPEMIACGVEYLKTFSLDYIIVPFLFCMNGLFTGAGHTVFSLINNALASVVCRIPAAYIFGMTLGYGLKGVGIGAPVASLIATIVAFIYFISGRWKKMTILK